MSDDLKPLMRSALKDYEAAGVGGSEGARAMREGLARIEGLESKLAKAVEALEFYAGQCEGGSSGCLYEGNMCCKTACAALAELKA